MALRKILTTNTLKSKFLPLITNFDYFRRENDEKPNHVQKIGIAVGLATGLILYRNKYHVQNKAAATQNADVLVENLPTYSANEISSHDSKEKKIWCSYKKGVYDITKFVDEHPGGDKILLASGGDLEPFWKLYAVHQSDEVLKVLERFRIGNLDESDRSEAGGDMGDPYESDPKRSPVLKAASVKPFNAEPPLKMLVDSYITPNDLFYVRNHLPVPVVDPNTFELEVSVDGTKYCKTFSLRDLKTKFIKHTVTATIQCAGNRRSEMMELKKIKGLNWNAATIGNATWSGPRLKDILKMIGVSENCKDRFNHVQFEGLDMDPTGTSYGASIIFEKALDEDVILAYEMNGEILPPDHGFPLRVIVPGVVGARNVKWLTKIVVSEKESESHWQQHDYKSFPPHIDWDTVDFKSAPAIQELPVQSAICEPGNGDRISRRRCGNKVKVKGYAWSGGGKGIIRVDISPDNGENWIVAKLTPTEIKLQHSWAWTLWEAEIPLPRNTSTLTLLCRAFDSSYNTQPERVAPIWNLRGVVNNAWHRVKIEIIP